LNGPPSAVPFAARLLALLALPASALIAGCAGPAPTGARRAIDVTPQAGAVTPGSIVAGSPCRSEILRAHGLQVQAQDCRFGTGRWRVRADDALPGFALWRDDERVTTVIHILRKPAAAPLSSVLPALAARGLIPPEDCVFAPADLRIPAAPGRRHHDIRPQGRRLAQLLATPADQVPDPPCGDYGASTHGVRYFITDDRHPTWVLYVNVGQDGTQIDPSTLAITAKD
jgi:hypothetical protein